MGMAPGGPSREELLSMAIQTAKQGNKDGARMMLQQILNDDKTNERAMLWMAKIARNSAERKKWLELALKTNPKNSAAKKALDKMERTETASESRKLLVYGGAAIGAFMVITLVLMIFWAFAPLS